MMTGIVGRRSRSLSVASAVTRDNDSDDGSAADASEVEFAEQGEPLLAEGRTIPNGNGWSQMAKTLLVIYASYLENVAINPIQQTPLAHYPVLYAMVMVFVVIFQLHFLSERTATILIDFCTILMSVIHPTYRFPVSLSTLRQYVGFDSLTRRLRSYVSCQQCHKLYLMNNLAIPNLCDNDDIRYDGHCGHPLFRNIAGQNSPSKVFVYQPLAAWMDRLFSRPGFEAKLEHWRT